MALEFYKPLAFVHRPVFEIKLKQDFSGTGSVSTQGKHNLVGPERKAVNPDV